MRTKTEAKKPRRPRAAHVYRLHHRSTATRNLGITWHQKYEMAAPSLRRIKTGGDRPSGLERAV